MHFGLTGMSMRIGHGYDVHAFGPGEWVILGGVRIAHEHGLVAHSDGDVVIHAVCDALLGAAGMGDIGHFFPDTDAKHAGQDSRRFLEDVVSKVTAAGLKVINVDVTVIAQAPKIAPHIDAMRATLAESMKVSANLTNIKATTHEGIGALGRAEGIAAHAVALLEYKS